MLVGQRRRLLHYLQRTDLDRYRGADPGARAAAMIEPGTPAPDFTLPDQDGNKVTLEDLRGETRRARLLPARLQPGLHRPAQRLPGGARRARGARGRGSTASRSTPPSATRPSSDHLGHRRSRCSPTSTRRARWRAGYGVYVEDYGVAERALVMIGPGRDGRSGRTCRPRRSRSRAPTSSSTRLTSSAPPEPGRGRPRPRRRAARHRVRRLRVPLLREGRRAARRACPSGACSATSRSSRSTRARGCSPHAAEAAALQGASGRCTTRCSPTRATSTTRTCGSASAALGLDLDRFEADRRSDAVAERVERDFRSGIRAGVTTTPTLFVDGEAHPGVPAPSLLERLAKRDRK